MKASSDRNMTNRIPILVDTDPGVDDFFCIALACAFPELFDVKAICTIGGNNTTDVTTANALNILKLLEREDIPVARGADSYLTEEFSEPVEKFHGRNGLGNVEIPAADRTADPLPAYEKIYQVAKECNGELIVVTVGPETNLALAFEKHPDLSSLIKKIVVMGGTTDKGNVTEYAEANIWHDAPAAKIVFESGVPIDMIGLNVTRQAPLRQEIFDGIVEVREDVKEVMSGLINFRNEEAMHDSIAFASLLNDKIFTWLDAYTYVIADHSEHHGQTVIEEDKERLNSRVAIGIDTEAYYRVMKDMIRRYTK
ncbi:MAG: nucleoside hydrolase [Erysipelotrichaceae bacterium]|nr:nucleoside hydrolase [Erysipelotrichaceae bacterium]